MNNDWKIRREIMKDKEVKKKEVIKLGAMEIWWWKSKLWEEIKMEKGKRILIYKEDEEWRINSGEFLPLVVFKSGILNCVNG